jgi:hypothetical protein
MKIPPFMKWFTGTIKPKELEIENISKYRFIKTEEAKSIYGIPKENPDYLTTIDLPYPMRLSWDKKVYVTKMRCHKLVADDFLNIFKDLLDHYGYDEIKRLGIDLFGGCFNFRKMRGGDDWSRHSWAIAIDLDPERNGLSTTWQNSMFSKKAYKPMIDIFYKYGFLNLGKEKGFDAMHYEKGVLI